MKTDDIEVGKSYVLDRGKYDGARRVKVIGIERDKWTGPKILIEDEQVSVTKRDLVIRADGRPLFQKDVKPNQIRCLWDDEWLGVIQWFADLRAAQEAATERRYQSRLPIATEAAEYLRAIGIVRNAEALAEYRSSVRLTPEEVVKLVKLGAG